MKEEPTDNVTKVAMHSTDSTATNYIKLEPIDDVLVPEIDSESEPLQMDPGAMEVSEAHRPMLCDACGFETDEKTAFEDHVRAHRENQQVAPDSVEYNSSGEHTPRPVGVHMSPVTAKLALSNEPVQLGDYTISDGLSESSQLGETVTEDVDQTVGVLQLKTSGEYSQDSGPSRSSTPKETPLSNKRFTCDVCGYKTNKKVTFEDHLRTHTGEKPFACDLCNYRSSSKHTLGKHKKIHTRPKPFKCDLCEYRGSTRSDLSRHTNTHTKSYSLNKGVFTPVTVPLQIALNEKLVPSSDPSDTAPRAVYTIFSYEPANLTNVAPNVSSTGSSDATGAPVPELAWQSNSSKAIGEFEETATRILQPTDDVMLLGSKAEYSNDPPENKLIPVHDGLPNDPLQMELSEEHSQDDDTSYSLEPGVIHTGNQRFTCDSCSYTSNRRHEFEVHLRTHTGETPFACDLCDKKYIAKKTLNRHKKAQHGERPYGCLLCNFRATHKSDLDEHVRGQHNKDGTANDPSKTEFEAQYEPNNHPLKSEQSEESDDDSPAWAYEVIDTGNNRFTCDVCGYEAQQECDLDSHTMVTHAGENLFACEFCDRKYAAKRTMDRHVRESHGEKLFGCGLCDYRTQKKEDLAEHEQTHDNNEVENASSGENEVRLGFEVVLNDVSNYSGPSESSQPGNDPLKTEFETHYEHANDPLQLNLSEEHSQDSSLSRNSEAEAFGTMIKRFTCDVCGYKTSRKYEFTVHMRTHTGEKPYGCSLCDYRSIKKSYVNKHMKTHLKNTNSTTAKSTTNTISTNRSQVASSEPRIVLMHDSPELNEASENSGPSESTPTVRSLSGDEHFTCEHCDYKCDDLTAWSQHMFEHTREKNYCCDDCDYQTKDIGRMNVHRKVHNSKEAVGSVTITCEFCNYPFTTKDDMSQHIVTCHPEKCPHSCDLCDFKAFSVRSLESHKETHAKPFTCNLSGYKVEGESLPSRHVVNAHVNVEEYVCYSCDYKASNVKDVEQHISTTHNLPTVASSVSVTTEMPLIKAEPSVPLQPGVQEYLCYACDYKANEVAQVEEHILNTHSTSLSHQVEVPGNYLVTSASNVGLEQYVCFACDFKAGSIVQVQEHIQVMHMDSPPIPESTASPLDVTSDAPSSIAPL